MTSSKQDKGARGEDIAAAYLESQGFDILHRNLRLSHLEIDLVCRDGRHLVFVEVKHALSDAFGHPATWIDARKQERLRRAAQMYIDKYDISGLDMRFDVVTIIRGTVEHYPNAF